MLLRDAAGNTERTGPESTGRSAPQAHVGKPAQGDGLDDLGPDVRPRFPTLGNGADVSVHWTFGAGGNDATSVPSGVPFVTPDMGFQSQAANAGATSYELLGLGLFEALPPTEMIEDL